MSGVVLENTYTGVSEESMQESREFFRKKRAKKVRPRPAADPARSGAREWLSENTSHYNRNNAWGSGKVTMEESFNPIKKLGFKPPMIWDKHEQEWVERERYYRIKALRSSVKADLYGDKQNENHSRTARGGSSRR